MLKFRAVFVAHILSVLDKIALTEINGKSNDEILQQLITEKLLDNVRVELKDYFGSSYKTNIGNQTVESLINDSLGVVKDDFEFKQAEKDKFDQILRIKRANNSASAAESVSPMMFSAAASSTDSNKGNAKKEFISGMIDHINGAFKSEKKPKN